MKTEKLITERLVLRQFKEADYDDLYEFLSQLKDDEFEGYPGITYENGREHLKYRVGSEEFYAIELKESGKVIGNIYCGIRDYEAKEVGYIVNKDYQRKWDWCGRHISGKTSFSTGMKTECRSGRILMFMQRCYEVNRDE